MLTGSGLMMKNPEILVIIFFIMIWIVLVTRRIFQTTGFQNLLLYLVPSIRNRIVIANLDVLKEHNNFFSSLSAEGQKRFIDRCGWFIATKRFLGMEGLKVTPEMKLRVAATAVQVTYGLKNGMFSHYHTVKLFPSTFYSRLHDRFLKGGASTSGVLFFSWEDFLHGFSDPSDRYNLGLHEMAHALRLQLIHGRDFDQQFANYSDQWFELAMPEFERMNEGKTSFLREYGAENMEEFFAVCIEHFFEVPDEFRQKLPDIYNHLCFLLNLDPSRDHDDYKLAPDFIQSVNRHQSRIPIPERVKRTYKYDSWNWSYNLVLTGMFVALPVILVMHGKVLFTAMHIVLIFTFVAAVITSFRGFFREKGIVYFRHLMFFCVTGAGPLASAFVLITNYYICVSYDHQVYRVTGYAFFEKNESGARNKYVTFRLENNAYETFEQIRTFQVNQLGNFQNDDVLYVDVSTANGIFGLRNFLGSQLVRTSAKEPD